MVDPHGMLHTMFYPGFKFIVFEFKISFYLHTIWTFTKREEAV
jgi:hypothetical protein